MMRADRMQQQPQETDWTREVTSDSRHPGRGVERRRRPPPDTQMGYLHQMPGSVLVSRLPHPILAVGLDGILIYTNPAFARMLGYAESAALTGQSLSALLAGHSETSPQDCVTILRNAASTVIDWLHLEGGRIHTVTSDPLLTRADDPVLLISVTDISEYLWNTPPAASRETADPTPRPSIG